MTNFREKVGKMQSGVASPKQSLPATPTQYTISNMLESEGETDTSSDGNPFDSRKLLNMLQNDIVPAYEEELGRLLHNDGVLIDVNWEGVEGASSLLRSRAIYTLFFQKSTLVLGRLVAAIQQVVKEDESCSSLLGQRIREITISCLTPALGSKPNDRTISFDGNLFALEYVTHLHEGPHACFSVDHIVQVLQEVIKHPEGEPTDFTLHGQMQGVEALPGFDWSMVEVVGNPHPEGHREPPPSRKGSRNTLSTSIDFAMCPKADLAGRMQSRLIELNSREGSPNASPTLSPSEILRLSLSDNSDNPLELSDYSSDPSLSDGDDDEPTIVDIDALGNSRVVPKSSPVGSLSPHTPPPPSRANINFPEPSELHASQSHGSVHYGPIEEGKVCCTLL